MHRIAPLFCIAIAAQANASLAADAHPSDLPMGPFGVGSCYINNRSVQDNARWIPQMEAIGVRYYRSCETNWGAVEPAEGQWNWEPLDAQMDYLAKHQLDFGGILLGNPKWNTLDNRGSLPVNNLAAWSKYVSETVRHARGRIKRWEVWNEPPNFTGRDQTPADYAKIVRAAYDTAKSADPDCLIGLAAKSAHINYLEQVIKAGAREHFDFITLHPYEILNGIADNAGTEPVFMNIAPVVRKMLAAQDPTRINAPILFTELGCDSRKGADLQAETLVKAYTMSIAQGVACLQWFEGRDGDSGPLGLLDAQGTPRPAYKALEQMIRLLGQHPTYLGWVLLNERDYGFVFQGHEAPVLIAWARVPDEVKFGVAVELVDPLTGHATSGDRWQLTHAPVLVNGAPEDLIKQAEKNKGRPLPWGGDYAAAKSVSLSTTNGERGLHSLSGDSLAQAVVAYGGPARAGNVPGGNLFVVDPAFLSYTTEPIEITAVVRRNEANDNAGFNLVYESTSGLKHAKPGWYTVPDSKQWHTVRWQIDDAQFVNFWGYNFAFVSDGNVYNKYYLESVTVTKRGE